MWRGSGHMGWEHEEVIERKGWPTRFFALGGGINGEAVLGGVGVVLRTSLAHMDTAQYSDV